LDRGGGNARTLKHREKVLGIALAEAALPGPCLARVSSLPIRHIFTPPNSPGRKSKSNFIVRGVTLQRKHRPEEKEARPLAFLGGVLYTRTARVRSGEKKGKGTGEASSGGKLSLKGTRGRARANCPSEREGGTDGGRPAHPLREKERNRVLTNGSMVQERGRRLRSGERRKFAVFPQESGIRPAQEGGERIS